MQILTNVIQQLQLRNNLLIMQYRQQCQCMVTTFSLTPIARNSVDMVFDLINNAQFKAERVAFKNPDDIHVIIESGGGDADAAYHIAKLIDTHFTGIIKYIVPRYAKSAATLVEVMKSDSPEWQAIWEVSKNNRTIADLIGVLQLINKLNPQTNR